MLAVNGSSWSVVYMEPGYRATGAPRGSDLRQRGVGGTSWRSEGGRQRETVNRHVLAGELEGNYISSNLQGSGVGSKLADFCNTASVGPRQYVLVRGSSEGWCRRSEVGVSHWLVDCGAVVREWSARGGRPGAGLKGQGRAEGTVWRGVSGSANAGWRNGRVGQQRGRQLDGQRSHQLGKIPTTSECRLMFLVQSQVSGRGESHPPALAEPGVRVSPHRAPTGRR